MRFASAFRGERRLKKFYGVFIPFQMLHLCRCSIYFFGGYSMSTRIAVMGIIVENTDSVETLNALLHEYGKYIIGRMGIPYKEKNVNIVSIAIDAPQDTIAALAGKVGNIAGISVKTAYSSVITDE